MKTEPKGFWGRLPVAKGPPKTKPKLRLEFVFEVQLEAAAGVGRGGKTNMWVGQRHDRCIGWNDYCIVKIIRPGLLGPHFFFFFFSEIVSNRDVKIQNTHPGGRD